MRKSLYTLLALIMINSSTAVKPVDLVLDYGQRVVVTHPGIGPCEWAYNGQDFYVIHNEESYLVDPLYIDTELVGISKKNLLRFLSCGYLYINRLDNGEFTIKAQGRLNGGLPIFLLPLGAGVLSLIVSGIRSAGTPKYQEPVNNFQAAQARVEANIARTNTAIVQEKTTATAEKIEIKKIPTEIKQVPIVEPEIVQVPVEVVAKNDIVKNADEIIGSGTTVNIALNKENNDRVEAQMRRIEQLENSYHRLAEDDGGSGSGGGLRTRKGYFDDHLNLEENCIVGPGIPIGPVPVPGFGRLPWIKTAPGGRKLPILPGMTFTV